VTDSDDAELLQVFLEEAREHLDGIEGDFIDLESKDVLDLEVVNKIFRAVHSVKGGAGFFGLDAIKKLSHAMENVLGLMRVAQNKPSPSTIGTLLTAADTLVQMLENTAESADRDVSSFVAELEAIAASANSTQASMPATQPLVLEPQPTASLAIPTAISVAETLPDEPKLRPATPAVATEQPIPVLPLDTTTPAAATPAQHPPAPTTAANARPGLPIAESSIRVHVGILDRLMTLAGELVLTRNQLIQSHEANTTSHSEATQRIDHITTELQDAIMSTRMQSVGTVFQKFRRVVRDLANTLGKEVDLIIEGEDVELDRSIVEAIGDPLTHLVRNSLDHGIERPLQREQQGKPRRGTLRLSALHKAGQVIIEIADDGAGIDPARVRAKALEKGICTKEQLAGMSESAIIKLIFRPGFSTATEVTEVSGRGVGMDVVHSNLARLGGVVDVQSNVGSGTLMRIKLPLTLAIIPCLLVGEERESFAIPQANLIELHRVPARELKHRVKKFGDVLVLSVRGELIPLIRLRDALNMPQSSYPIDSNERFEDLRETGYDRRQNPTDADAELRSSTDRRHSHRSAVNIAVVAAGELHYGIMVETLLDSLEIVVKPLGRHLRSCNSYAGATILGDGRLALILDVVAIGRRLQAADSGEALASAKLAAQRTNEHQDKMTLMLVENSGEELLAIPLGLIERIEHLKRSDIQRVGGKRTLTYRGKSLPLIGIEEIVNIGPCRDVARLYAVVYRSHEREVGLLVSDLVDIVDSSADLDELTHRQPGVFGSLLVDGKVTLLLDIHDITRRSLGITSQPEALQPERRVSTVLIVEDSRFFRERLIEFNRDAGYNVIVAEDGIEGLEALEKHADAIDLVITDIEMPRMDGLEFTRQLRRISRFRSTPVLAVTALMGEEAEDRGKQAGITEYLIKLDRERIMDRVKYHLSDGIRHWSAA
jgi:two-component system chemotaxis sensor kinase CheA